jgi:isopenicillin-N epimerase
MATSLSRRDFARVFAAGGSAALFAHPDWTLLAAAQGPPGGSSGGASWPSVRAQFVMPPDLAVINAANLCPASISVVEVLTTETRSVDRDPSPHNRARLYPEKEATRKALAAFLRVTPEEVVITRNTSEANNLVSSGVDLKPGDEVVIHADNHPSNLQAWVQKAKRFGFSVVTVEQKNPHPGMEYYIDAFTKAITPRTKVVAFTHMSSSVGDVFPAKEICRLARERGVLSLLDGAQSFGLYTGSAHKWPCGARECGVLYINSRSHDRIWPSIYSAYPGAVGISRTFEGFGQRDEATMIAFRKALELQTTIGRPAIERQARALTDQLMEGLGTLPDVKVWTSPHKDRRAAVVSFLPGSLNVPKLYAALYEHDKIALASRGGGDRGGLRASPHFYNTPEEIDRLVAALQQYLKAGV